MPVSMTFFGTTTWLLDDGETQLLLDAHLTRPSLLRAVFGKLKTNTAFVDEVLRRFPMERLQAIFVSHSHYDHVLDAAYIAQKTGADLYGTVSTKNVGLGGGLPEARLHLFEPGKPVSVGAFEITALPSIHSKPTVLNNDLGVVIERPYRSRRACATIPRAAPMIFTCGTGRKPSSSARAAITSRAR